MTQIPKYWFKGELFTVKKTFTCSIFTLLLGLFLSFSLLFAGIGVDPTVIERCVSQGGKAKGTFTVVNDGDESVQVVVQPENWPRKREAVDISSWLKIKPEEFKLGAKGVRKVKYKVRVPKDAEGELTSMVFFATTAPAGRAVNIRTRFGVALYVTVKGTEILEGEILDLKIKKTTSKEKREKFHFTALVENGGNVHFRPRGKVIIENGEGKKLDEVEIQYGWPVFPNNKRLYRANWEPEEILPGTYRTIAIFNYGDIYSKLDKQFEKNISFEVTDKGEIVTTEIEEK